MKMPSAIPVLLVVLSCFVLAGPVCAGEVGRVIALTPGAFAERGGDTVALSLKSPVHANDVLVTDSTGKVQVLFDDDSSVSLSPGTRLALQTVIPQGDAPAFKASLGEGMARFITGKIVERNPEGFSVMTPESTIGIRGTIFAVRRDGYSATTSVYVLNTARQVIVNGITIPGDHKITIPGGNVMPLTPTDIRAVNVSAAVRPAAPTPQTRDSLPETPLLTEVLERPDTPVPSTTLPSDILLVDQGSGDSLADSVTGSSTFNGTVTGTLSASNNVTGTFSFNANLSSGSISGGVMNGGNGAGTNFNASGGNGYINGSRFGAYNGWTGTMQVGGGAMNAINNAKIYGDVDISSSGITVDGDFGVYGGGDKVIGKATGGS